VKVRSYRHWEQPLKLPERHLLAGLRRDGLNEQLGGWATVQMREKTVNPGLAKASKLVITFTTPADVTNDQDVPFDRSR
jgi:hypothetical protein